MRFSRFGAILAAVYLVVATTVVILERQEKGGGNWISIRGMGSFLITFPVSAVAEWLGSKLDHRRNLDMAVAIGICALLVYLSGAGLGRLARLLFGPTE